MENSSTRVEPRLLDQVPELIRIRHLMGAHHGCGLRLLECLRLRVGTALPNRPYLEPIISRQ